MRYRYLGRTGVQVSEYMLGTMSYGSDGNTDKKECMDIVHCALDRGINFIDTADTYSHGEAEEIVGKAITGRRDKVVLATKFRLAAGEGRNEQGGSRYWIMKQVENSLRRLNTDHIDLYQLHRPDPETDLEETLGALSDLVAQGKVRYIGCSTLPSLYLAETQSVSRLNKTARFVNESSLLHFSTGGGEGDAPCHSTLPYGFHRLEPAKWRLADWQVQGQRLGAVRIQSRARKRTVGTALPNSANAIRHAARG